MKQPFLVFFLLQWKHLGNEVILAFRMGAKVKKHVLQRRSTLTLECTAFGNTYIIDRLQPTKLDLPGVATSVQQS